MANPELGAKQICPTCSSKFYDLGRRPAHCPKCGSEFDPEEALRNRRVRTRAPLPEEEAEEVKPVPAESEEEEEFEAVEEAPELDADVVGSVRPLRDLRLPFVGDVDKLLSALQGNLATIRVEGTVHDPKVQTEPFAGISSSLREFILGDVRSQTQNAAGE